jgi:putative redox protein
VSKPPTRVTLTWTGDLAFDVATSAPPMVVDGNTKAAASPVELLGVALAGCMGSDVAHILTKGRQSLTSLEVTFEARRADEAPRRWVSVHVHFAVGGDVARAQLDRAIALSRDKYCSVWHTLRPDLPLELTATIEPAAR